MQFISVILLVSYITVVILSNTSIMSWLDVSWSLSVHNVIVGRYGVAKNKFQVVDSDAYYVHHMSRYEHFVHKSDGFEVAKNKTLIMSKAAYEGECANLRVNSHREFLAIIPFYGGLPPNVTKDLTVKSIGQGNSLVTKTIPFMPRMKWLLLSPTWRATIFASSFD